MTPGALANAVPIAEPVEITSGLPESDWDRFVDAHPAATAYHTWRWRRVFEHAFGHQTVYLAARRGGAVAGVLPLVVMRSRLFGRFAVSLPFVNYGGVCAEDDDVARALVEHAAALAREEGLAHVELRHVARRFPDLPARQHKVDMQMPLERDPDDMFTSLDRKVRNHVRRAQKSGLVARAGRIELVDRFYRVFAHNMRDLGTPVYSIRFFEQVLSTFPATTNVFVVEDGGVTTAAAIAITHRDTIEVPWASSLRSYRQSSPNTLLYWHIVEHAIAHGLTTFDFGRSTPNDGPFQFKLQWGARPRPLHWEYALVGRADLPNLSPANERYRTAVSAWKRLPLSVANWIGPHIVRSIP